MQSLLELYCDVDDFWQRFRSQWYRHLLAAGEIKRVRAPELSESEVMTIVIDFHRSGYRTFKAYYSNHVLVHLRSEFPRLISYNRFVELMQRIVIPLGAYLRQCYGVCTGISFIDSTSLVVCENCRIQRHRVFRGVAQRGKSSLGWFYGFKLHLVTNDRGELLAVRLTPGNVDDRQPVPELAQTLFGKLFGDRGYLSQPLFEQLFEQGLQLITHLRKNMPNRLIPLQDKLLLRRRNIIETINDQLKNISQIEHTRHRSLLNCLVNVLAGLIAYCHQPKKPSLHLHSFEQAALLVL
jgi:transposase